MRSSLPVARPTADLSQPYAPPVGLSLAPPAAQGSEASPAARNTLDSARIPRASKLLICGLFQEGRVLAQDEEAPGVTHDTKAFTAAIRTRVFAFLRAWSIGDDEAALRTIDSEIDADGELWSPERLHAAREAFRVDHAGLRLDPEARNLRHTHVKLSDDRTTWRVEQMLVDLEDLNDWIAELGVNLETSREAGQPMIQLLRLETLV